MTKQNIVVVGAGYAGVSATKFLAKKFKKDKIRGKKINFWKKKI